LVLLALGPTATALSYDLHKKGYQSIDIGHMPVFHGKSHPKQKAMGNRPLKGVKSSQNTLLNASKPSDRGNIGVGDSDASTRVLDVLGKKGNPKVAGKKLAQSLSSPPPRLAGEADVPTNLVSSDMAMQNEAIHVHVKFGTSGGSWKPEVLALMRRHKVTSVLDFGCGQGTLGASILAEKVLREEFPTLRWCEYDPGIPKKRRLIAEENAVDLVTATDVLEHIEPEKLVANLQAIAVRAKKAIFFVIAYMPSGKILPDGRNSHLIQEKEKWWRKRLAENFPKQYWTIDFHKDNPKPWKRGVVTITRKEVPT